MPFKTSNKAQRISVSIKEDLLKFCQMRADALHGGSLSKYFQSLAQSDMEGGENSPSNIYISSRIEDLQSQLNGLRAVAEEQGSYKKIKRDPAPEIYRRKQTPKTEEKTG